MAEITQFGNRAMLKRSRWPIYLLVSLFVLLLSATGVRGQETYSVQPQWAVLDFSNAADDPAAGQAATDSVVQELTLIGRYALSNRPDILTGLQLLGLSLPLSVIGERRLGRLLGVDDVVTGSVDSIVFVGTTHSAQVTMTIKVRNVRTGELINGASVIGQSEASQSTSDQETTIDNAIDNAAFTAIAQMSQYVLPHATVLMRESPHTVLLNQGAQEGLRPGLSMVVTRFGDRIGLIKVISVETDQARAQVLEDGGGIAAQDLATVIYTLPASPTH